MAAAVEASLNSNSRLERFDGTDPSSYRRWKRRAQLMLIGLPNTYPAEKLGPKLMEFLAGDAELAVEHIKVEDLAKAGGEKAVFKALDERYKPLERDNMNEALKEFFFETQIRSGETMQAFATRFSTTIRKLEEQEVKLPDAVKGWFLLRKLHLDSSQESMIMTGTGGSYEIKDIYKAVKAILPNVKGTASKSGRERDTLVAEHPAVSEDEDDSELVQVLAAELQQKDEYEDEELLDVYETYKQVRMKMNDAKKARGYRSTPAAGVGMGRGPWKLQGSISARLEQAKAASQCHRCKQYGHWKRECPKGKGKGGDARGSSSTAKEVHIVDSGAGFEDGDYEELIRDIDAEMEDELTGLDVYVAEHDRSGFMLERFRSSVGVGSQHAEVAKEALGQWSHQSMDDCEPRTVTSLGIEQRPEPVVLRSFEVHSSEKEFPSQAEYAAALDSHAVPDTACRKTLIGEAVLSRMELRAKELGWKVVRKPCKAVFKFGNAGSLTSEEAAIIPCMIGGRKLLLKASVLPGSGAGTPLLFSKELLKKLGAVINTTNDSLISETLGVTVKMRTTSKGHYALPLFDVEHDSAHHKHTPRRAHYSNLGSRRTYLPE